jgi:hypothetical protein
MQQQYFYKKNNALLLIFLSQYRFIAILLAKIARLTRALASTMDVMLLAKSFKFNLKIYS